MAKKDGEGSRTGNKPAAGKAAASDADRVAARHEAGHAVVAVHYEFVVDGIDIIPQVIPNSDGQMGVAGAEFSIPHVRTIVGKGEESVIHILTLLHAGYQAEKKINPDAFLEHNHSESDGARANLYATAAIVPPVIENGRKVTKGADVERYRDRINALLKRADDEAAALVQEYEDTIDALTDLLIEKGRLSGVDVDKFLTRDE